MGNIKSMAVVATLNDLRMADHFYFNLSKPRMSDADYDAKREQLEKWYKQGIMDKPLEATVRSYLSGTGILPAGSGKKVTLAIPMPSLDKIKNDEPESLTKWIASVVKACNNYDVEFISSPKLDGSSMRLAYDAKTLEFAYATTRGDGVTGRDITPQARALIEAGKIPAKLKPNKDYAKMAKLGEKHLLIRCEIIIEEALFKKNWEGKTIDGSKLVEARNSVNGFVNATKSFNTRFVSSLTVFALTVVTRKMPTGFVKKTSQLQYLRDSGFTTYNHLPGFGRFNRDAITVQMLDDLLFKGIKGPYKCDGIVVETNEVTHRHNLDKGEKRPLFARAYKLGNSASVESGQQRPQTSVTQIEWRPTKDGKQMPLVHYKPVRFGNTTNTKASGVHADWIKKMGLGTGAKIEVVRAGDVIPRIDKVLVKSKDKLPKKCACGAKLVYVKPNLYCSKPAKCSVSQRLRLEAAVKTLAIPGLAGAKIGQLYDAGYTSITKLASVNAVKLSSLDGWGMVTAHKITKELRTRLKEADLTTRMELSNVFTEPGFVLSGSRLTLITDNLKTKTILTADDAMKKRIKKKLSGIKGMGDGAIALFVKNLDAFQKFNRVLTKKMAVAGIK